MKNDKVFELPEKYKTLCIWGALVGVICFSLGLYLDPTRSWMNLMLNNFYFTSLALGGIVFLSIQYVTKSSWSRPFTRIAEAIGAFLPLSLVITIGVFAGIHSLYEWSHHDIVAKDALIALKTPYLNTTFFIIRTIMFFLFWLVLSRGIIALSGKQAKGKVNKATKKLTVLSCLFLIGFAYTYSFFSFDMIMSLEPHWFSTIFGIYTFSGLFVNIFAVITLLAIILQHHGYLKNVITEDHYHDLGKYIFGFSTFWAYIWFSQYLLIWYSNIPEETQYYYLREHYTWDWLFYANLVINWIIPFFALMTRESKRRKFILSRVCVVLIVGHWLDLYLMVAPPVLKHAHVTNPSIGWMEIGTSIGFASLFILIVSKALKKKTLTIESDPYFEEGLHLEQ